MVQGPPGTGKTHTIVAIASALLLAKATGASSARSLPQKVATYGTGSRVRTDMQALPQSRLLVCAQSNAAVDELVSRLAAQVLKRRSALHNNSSRGLSHYKTVHRSEICTGPRPPRLEFACHRIWVISTSSAESD
jgi:superfamily I DNA and/or RNA helicase